MTATITPIGGNGGTPPPSPKPARRKRRKQRLSKNRRSNGCAYDDLTLVIERALVLCRALIDRMDESSNEFVLAHQVRMELEDLEAVASPAPDDWYAE